MTQFAMVFPGQGSQSLGMMSDLAQHFPIVNKLYEQASSLLHYDLWQLVQTGPEQQLNQTEYTQPALLVADVALWHCWQQLNEAKPNMMAGHSLGEFAALVCAEALAFEDAVGLVAKRGQYMQQAVPAGSGAMAAVIGLTDEQTQQLCQEVAQDDEVLSPANYNSVGQVVVAGHHTAVTRLLGAAKAAGAKIAKFIPVSVPSHCALMQSAADQLQADLANVVLSAPKISVIQNADVQSYSDASAISNSLIKQLTHPVRWVETIHHIEQSDITTLVEAGPGKVLTGLNRRISKALTTYPTATYEQLTAAVTVVKETCDVLK